MNFKLWRNYSAFLKTAGFWLIVLAYLGEPNLLASVGAIVMLAAWYLRDYVEKAKPLPNVHRLKHGHERKIVEEMCVLLVEYPSGWHKAFFESSKEYLVGSGTSGDRAMCDVAGLMINRFGGQGFDGSDAAAKELQDGRSN